MNAWIAIFAVVSICLAAAILLTGIYNELVKLKNRCDSEFAQIEVQLKRRHDLIPNLVECVKGYMTHERETLEQVTAARNQAVAGLRRANQHRNDSDAQRNWMGAEATLASAIGHFSIVLENYPDLQANESIADLTEQLKCTENRIEYAREAFNDWVTGFNMYRERFPQCLFASLFGFRQNRSLIEFANSHELVTAPSVQLA